ncbi:MAG: ATP-binding protein [Nanoarchaeota archaeon]
MNTAVLFFGKRPEDFLPNARLRCAVFGETTATTIDMQDYFGDVFTLIEKAEKYILANIHIGMRLEGLYRVDVPEIDKEAFREALINAFCHRDYWEYDSVNVAIFKNKLEIRSPGGLYGGLTIEKIKKEEVSRRRNEIIAEMFHQIHFVEKWGRGISLMLEKEPTVDFKEVAGIFITTFKRKNPPTTPQASLTELELKIVNLIKGNKNISRAGIAQKLGISGDTVKEYLEKLKKKEILVRKGKTSSGYWKIL